MNEDKSIYSYATYEFAGAKIENRSALGYPNYLITLSNGVKFYGSGRSWMIYPELEVWVKNSRTLNAIWNIYNPVLVESMKPRSEKPIKNKEISPEGKLFLGALTVSTLFVGILAVWSFHIIPMLLTMWLAGFTLWVLSVEDNEK